MRILSTFLLALLPLAVGGCATVGHHEAGIDNFDQVSPTVYRGAQPTEEGFRTLSRYNVKTVINLRDSDDSREAQMARDAGMNYVHLPLDAESVTAADARRILDLLADAPTPIFVHCHVGRDRTGLAIAAYRVEVQGWSREAAVRDMNDHGHFWLFFPKVRAAITSLAQADPVAVKQGPHPLASQLTHP